MSSLVLLHGAWHQPAHFDDVVGRLRGDGFTVHVPDLAGLSLAESTRLVQTIVDDAPEPPLLLAHSFGGVTACGVRGVAHLLFLNSFIFDAGESPQAWIARVAAETGQAAAPLPLIIDEAGMSTVDPGAAKAGLYADCDDEVADRAIALLRAEPLTIFAASPTYAAWRDTPSTYIAGSEDQAIPPEMVGYFAERCTNTETWPTSHSPYLSRPELVVGMVRNAAAHTRAGG